MNLFLFSFLIFLIFSFIQSRPVYRSGMLNAIGYQEKQKLTIKRNILFYNTLDISVTGTHSESMVLPLHGKEVRVYNSFFLNCINYNSNGGAISCREIQSSIRPFFFVESSTFYECHTFQHNGKGGALFIEGYTFLSNNNCFSSCTSSSGVFGYFQIRENFECYLNQSIFHTNAKPRIGEGSIIVSSDYLSLIDNNFTNICIGSDGSGIIANTRYEFRISRNIFKDSIGQSIIFIVTIPSFYLFQLLNFIGNIENGNGIISIPSNYMISKCYFYNNSKILINSLKGSTLLYQCIFDSSQQSYDSIFKGSIQNKDASWIKGDNNIKFGINQYLGQPDNDYCQGHHNGNIESIFTPTRTPYFYKFSPNPADIVILVCIGLVVIFIIFTVTYILWYCICSKPNLRSSIKYLKAKDADKYVELLSSISDYDDSSLVMLKEKRNKKKKKDDESSDEESKTKLKNKQVSINTLSDSIASNSDNNVSTKNKKSKKNTKVKGKTKKRVVSDDEDSGKILSNSNGNESLNQISDTGIDSDPKSKPKAKRKFGIFSKSKSKSKPNSKSKSKQKAKDNGDLENDLNPDSVSQSIPEIKQDSGSQSIPGTKPDSESLNLSENKFNSDFHPGFEAKPDSESLPIPDDHHDSGLDADISVHDSLAFLDSEPKEVENDTLPKEVDGGIEPKHKSKDSKGHKRKDHSKSKKSKSKPEAKSDKAEELGEVMLDDDGKPDEMKLDDGDDVLSGANGNLFEVKNVDDLNDEKFDDILGEAKSDIGDEGGETNHNDELNETKTDADGPDNLIIKDLKNDEEEEVINDSLIGLDAEDTTPKPTEKKKKGSHHHRHHHHKS